MAGKWRTSGTQRLVSRRIPARYAALCIPGYGRVPSLCDERVQTDGMTFIQPLFGGFSPMVVYCAVGAIRWVMADDGVRQPSMVGEVGKCESRR